MHTPIINAATQTRLVTSRGGRVAQVVCNMGRTDVGDFRDVMKARIGQLHVDVPIGREHELDDYLADSAQRLYRRFKMATRPFPLVPGQSVPVFGVEHVLRESSDGRAYRDPKAGVIYATPDHFASDVKRVMSAELRKLVLDRIEFHSDRLAVTCQAVEVRCLDDRRAWGTCFTRDDEIAIEWRLAGAPPRCIDSVCAHEVAHLRVPNHGREFWETVYSTMPMCLYDKAHAQLTQTAMSIRLLRLGRN